jgi:TolB-like protein/class 3 adenylate cyclase
MRTGVVKRRLTTVLSADIVGYSGLVASDDEAAVTRLRRYREIVEALIARHDGRIFNFAGDGLMAEFPSAVEAVRSALEMQEEIALRNAEAPAHQAMRFRIGINVGETITEDDDLLGDGVNIAARLQAIAEPGGIVVSASAYEQIKNKVSVPIEPLGPRTLKNIPDPVTVFHVGGVATTPVPQPTVVSTPVHKWKGRSIAAGVTVLALAGAFSVWDIFIERESQIRAFAAQAAQPLPREPSIVVLPFVNAGGDDGHEYFSDGVTEDIITDLTKISGLFVVGRDSAFAYRGKFVQARHVGRDLGVRYVLQGSVRREDNRVRVSTYLVDAATERTLWATRQDRTLGNVFAMQDEIAGNVAQALAVSFQPGERENLRQQYAQVPKTYDLFLQARRKLIPPTPANLRDAKQLFEQVVAIDDSFAGGHAGLSLTHSLAVSQGYSRTQDALVAAVTEAESLARKAMQRDARSTMAMFALSLALLQQSKHDEAVEYASRAYIAQPGDAYIAATLGFMLTFAGRAHEAFYPIERAIERERVPEHRARAQFFKQFAAYVTGDYGTAEEAYRAHIEAGGQCHSNCLAYAAATKLRLADKAANDVEKDRLTEEARAIARILKNDYPNYLTRLAVWKNTHKNPADGERFESDAKRALDLVK